MGNQRKRRFWLIVGAAIVICVALLTVQFNVQPVQSNEARFVITNFPNGRRILDRQLNIVCYNTYYESDPGRLWCLKLELPIDKSNSM